MKRLIWKKAVEISQTDLYQNILIVYGTAKQTDSRLLHTFLTEGEVAYANRIRMTSQKNTWIACRVVLRQMLGSYFDLKPIEIELKKNRFGRLFVANSNLFFNVSHTDSSFLLGFNVGGKIGVDLEKLSGHEDLASLIDYAFSPEETEYCLGDELSAHFLEIWTLKEAALKAAGVGLVDKLKSVNVYGYLNNHINQKKFCKKTFICPNGETASLVYKNDQSINYIWLC